MTQALPQLSESDATVLDRFVQQEMDSSLLQSWMWGEFQRAVGRKIWRLVVRGDARAAEGRGLRATALVIKHELPLGWSYLYCPRGPVVAGQSTGDLDRPALSEIVQQLKLLAQQEKAVFVRVDPPLATSTPEKASTESKLGAAFLELGFKSAANQIQPRVTARLDLLLGRDKLLANMKSKARYNIRLAAKKEVTVRESLMTADVETFLRLSRETTARDEFIAHEDAYYRTQFDLLGKMGMLKLFVAEYKDKPLAVIAVAFHGRTATYLHGVSSNAERNRMPTFAVQWEAIKAAERLGLHWYDFHGVAPTDDAQHPWAGITRFKLGFGAERLAYVGALDLPIQRAKYLAYKVRVKMRRGDGR